MEAILQVDEQGQLKLPQAMLDILRARTPCHVKAETAAGKIEISLDRAPQPVVLVEENGLLVAENSIPFSAVDAIAKDREERL